MVVLSISAVGVSLRAQNDGSATPSVKSGTSVPGKVKASAVPPPDWIKEISPSLPGPFGAMKPCSVLYKLSWNNTVGAGEVTVNLLENGAFWVGTSSAASTGFARALWTYDCTLASVVDRASLRTDHFGHVEIDGNRLISRSSFARTVWLPKPGICPSQARRTSHCIRGVFLAILRLMICFQPFSMCVARNWKKGDRIKRVVQPFNVPYLVTYIVKGPEKRDVQGKDFSTIKVDVEIQKVDRRTLALAAYDKMKSATLWVSTTSSACRWRFTPTFSSVLFRPAWWKGNFSKVLPELPILCRNCKVWFCPPSHSPEGVGAGSLVVSGPAGGTSGCA